MSDANMNVTPQAAVDEPVVHRRKKADEEKEKKTPKNKKEMTEPKTAPEKKEITEADMDADTIYLNDNYYYQIVNKLAEQSLNADVELMEDGTVVVTFVGKDKYQPVYDIISEVEGIDTIETDVFMAGEDDNPPAKPMRPADVVDDDVVGTIDTTETVDLSDVEDMATFVIYAYPYADDALLDAEEEMEYDESRYDDSGLFDDSARLNEVKRKWKVNARGVKRLKMKCKPGFKWNGKACEKITGAQLSKKRMAVRKMVRTKRAQGETLKRRVKRLSNKARRYRKSYGIK